MDVARLRESFARVAAHGGDAIALYFYSDLFLRHQRPGQEGYHPVEMLIAQVQARVCRSQVASCVIVRAAEGHRQERCLHGGQFHHVDTVEQRAEQRVAEGEAIELRRHLPYPFAAPKALIQAHAVIMGRKRKLNHPREG